MKQDSVLTMKNRALTDPTHPQPLRPTHPTGPQGPSAALTSHLAALTDPRDTHSPTYLTNDSPRDVRAPLSPANPTALIPAALTNPAALSPTHLTTQSPSAPQQCHSPSNPTHTSGPLSPTGIPQPPSAPQGSPSSASQGPSAPRTSQHPKPPQSLTYPTINPEHCAVPHGPHNPPRLSRAPHGTQPLTDSTAPQHPPRTHAPLTDATNLGPRAPLTPSGTPQHRSPPYSRDPLPAGRTAHSSQRREPPGPTQDPSRANTVTAPPNSNLSHLPIGRAPRT